jgi:hypothetical protein
MSIKTGNLGVKYPTAWIQIDQFTLQTAFPDTRTAIIKGTRPALALDGIETGARKLSIQEDTGDIFIRTETGAPLVRITTAGNDAKIGILDGVNTLVLDKLHAIGVHPALALDDRGGFGTTHRIVSKQSDLIIQDDFLGIDLVTISSISQDMFVNNGKVGALAGVVVPIQDKFHAIGPYPALRLQGIEVNAKTYRVVESEGRFVIENTTDTINPIIIGADGIIRMHGNAVTLLLKSLLPNQNAQIMFTKSTDGLLARFLHAGLNAPGSRYFGIVLDDMTADLDDFRIFTKDNLGNIKHRIVISHKVEPAFIRFGDTTGALQIIPALDNTVEIGTDVRRFQRVRAVTITSGDIELKNNNAHWILTEEKDRLIAINKITNKRYELVLREV